MFKKIHLIILIITILLNLSFSFPNKKINIKITDLKNIKNSVSVSILLFGKNNSIDLVKGEFKNKKCTNKIDIKPIKKPNLNVLLIISKNTKIYKKKEINNIFNKFKNTNINLFIYSNNKIKKFFNNNKITFNSNNFKLQLFKKFPLIVFIGPSPFINQINYYLKKKKQKIVVGFIVTEGEFKSKNSYQNIAFNFSLNDKTEKDINKFFKNLLNSQYKINFIPCTILKKMIVINLLFSSNKKSNYYYPLKISFSGSFIKKYNSIFVYSTINKFVAQKKYKMALNILSKNKTLFQSKKYNDELKFIFTSWGNTLINQKTDNSTSVFVLIKIAENRYRLRKYKWYEKLKIKLLKNTLNYSLSDKIKFKILKILVSEFPKDKNLKYQFLVLQGNIFFEDQKYWQALESYHQATHIKESKLLVKKIEKLLLSLFRDEFKENKFDLIFKQGEKYPQYFRNNFELIYYYAVSCERTRHFKKSLEYYKYIFENWQSNKLITWNKLISSLQNNYLYNFQFEHSYIFLKRNYRLTDNTQLLDLAIAILRAKYIYSYLLFLNNYLKLTNQKINNSNLNSYFNRKFKFYSYEIMNKKNIKNNFLIRIDAQNLILYKKNKTNLLKVTISSNYKNEKEIELLNNIQKYPENETIWDKLESYEYFDKNDLTGIKILSYFLRDLFQLDLKNFNPQYLDNYRNIISKISYLKYIVIHNKNGKILSSINFKKSLANYPPNKWKKSSVTIGFFKQDILYGINKIIDISIPLFNGARWEGVVRLGYKSLK